MRIILNFRSTVVSAVKNTSVFAITALLITAVTPSFSRADEQPSELRFANGRFEPASLTIPANTPVRVKVINDESSAVEFESFELNREKVIRPGQSITVFIPSLNPGTYHFHDDLHEAAGQGTLVAK
jgi:hypothetical protein